MLIKIYKTWIEFIVLEDINPPMVVYTLRKESAYKDGSSRQVKLAENKINNIFSSDYIIENNK